MATTKFTDAPGTGSTIPGNAGVWGDSYNIGLAGTASRLGVLGTSVTDDGLGVYGQNKSPMFGAGVMGEAWGLFGHGVVGSGARGTKTVGVLGNGTSRGVYGKSSDGDGVVG